MDKRTTRRSGRKERRSDQTLRKEGTPERPDEAQTLVTALGRQLATELARRVGDTLVAFGQRVGLQGSRRPGHARAARRAGVPRRARLERFGAIIQLVRPRALVFVDRARARRLGLAGSANGGENLPGANQLWSDPFEDGQVGRAVLSAPLEAHLQLTNR